MNPLELVKSICFKLHLNVQQLVQIDTTNCIVLNKWLGFDPRNLKTIEYLIDYLWWIEPEHYYYLLYYWIPKSTIPKFIKKVEAVDTDKLHEKICRCLNWSEREFAYNKSILNHTIKTNPEYWKSEFGLK
jgi:hypothetical protein